MKVIPVYGKFYVSGMKTKNAKLKFLGTKMTLNRAIRLAHKYEKRGWYDITIMDDESCNRVYSTHW